VKLSPQKLVAFTVVATIACGLLTFFVKARPDETVFVSPRQELPNYTAQYPDTTLRDRIVKTYDLALILVQSPYMQKNFNALECIRRWARDNFAEHPDFLHPVVLSVKEANHDTVFGAFGHNLFSAPHEFLESIASAVVRARVQNFHQSNAYSTFRTAFFDFFGWYGESAVLLARYENDRAKIGADAFIWGTAWAAGAVGAAIYLFRNRKKAFFDAVRKVTAGTWTILALAYFLQAWQTERASSLLSTFFATATALYLYIPVAIIHHEEAGRRLARIRFTPNWTALAAWLTVSFLAIQVLTWIRHSATGATDPITMLVGALSGNFVHDPAQAKRSITVLTGVLWLAFSYWAYRQQSKTYEPEIDIESRFNELDAVAPLARIR
jgi:hypothetical protein